MARIFQHSFLLILLLFTVSCAHLTTERRHPDCEVALSKANCIGVLPAKAEVKTVGLGGSGERKYDYEYRVEEIVADEANKILQEKGYRTKLVRKRDLRKKKAFADFDRSKDRLDEATGDFYTSGELMQKEEAYNIHRNTGRYSRSVGKTTQSDVLLYINYVNNVKKNSARAAGFLLDALQAMGNRGNHSISRSNNDDADTVVIMLTLVDAKTGNVLWSNFSRDVRDIFADFFSGKDDAADRKRVRQVIQFTLEPLPDKDKLLASKE
ncbi:MAG: hypothetical protein RLN62_04360 [Rickettsiales bacterium]